MRVVVISLDALEHKYVEEFSNMNYLKQKYYGRVDLEPYFITRPEGIGGREPLTTHIYSVYFTGKLPDKSQGYSNYDEFIVEVKSHKHDTIFEHAKKPFATDIPAYTFNSDFGKTDDSWVDIVTGSPLFGGYFRDIFTLEEAEKAYYSYMTCKTEVIKLLNKLGNDLIFIYYKEPDKLQHMWNDIKRDKEKYTELYNKCNYFTKELINTFDDKKTLILVLSDHGVNGYGGHSQFGFWSSNIDIGYSEDIPINDFYKIIIEWLEKDGFEPEPIEKDISDENKKILAERLRKLGYVI